MELQMIDTEVFAAAPRPLRLTVRPRPAPSYWSLFVWSVAEGFGGPYMPGTRPPVPIWLHPDSGCDQLCPFGCIHGSWVQGGMRASVPELRNSRREGRMNSKENPVNWLTVT